MWREIKQCYGLGARFAVALPLILASPVPVEVIQHVIEWRIGMFESAEMAKSVESHPARMGFGYVKIGAAVPDRLLGLALPRL